MPRRILLLAIVAALGCTALVGWHVLSARGTSQGTLPFDLGALFTAAPSAISPGESPAVVPRAISPTANLAASQAAPTPREPSAAELQAAALMLRATLVNIICVAPPRSGVTSISASGIIVTPTGYVLTNAHVAEYFLLASRGVACKLRIGNPAETAYKAQVAYIPARWVTDNIGILTDPAPSGTGEHDFALLAITASATKAELPSRFPYISLASSAPVSGTPVVIGTYGAQALSLAQIESALSPTVVASVVKGLFTFDTSTIDVLTFGGSAAAQEGSSGGGVLGLDMTLSGVVATSATLGSLADRSLSAITTPYIRREYEAETGANLDVLLATPPGVAVATFTPQARALEALVLSTLPAVR